MGLSWGVGRRIHGGGGGMGWWYVEGFYVKLSKGNGNGNGQFLEEVSDI